MRQINGVGSIPHQTKNPIKHSCAGIAPTHNTKDKNSSVHQRNKWNLIQIRSLIPNKLNQSHQSQAYRRHKYQQMRHNLLNSLIKILFHAS